MKRFLTVAGLTALLMTAGWVGNSNSANAGGSLYDGCGYGGCSRYSYNYYPRYYDSYAYYPRYRYYPAYYPQYYFYPRYYAYRPIYGPHRLWHRHGRW
jgi:hypothetical protein